ncbi:MAG: trehalose-phosphatase [Tagaea sp.]|nr:trehalose-phosphatase [Tagaea sp.]
MDATSDDAYFLDFDGTLIEIAPTPGEARVGQRVRAVLLDLARATRGATMIVSGRRIDAIDAMLGFQLPAAGQHGAEMRFRNPALSSVRLRIAGYRRLRARCAALCVRHPGATLEAKGSTLALHLNADDPHFPALHTAALELAGEWDGAIACVRAHNVVELRPAHVHKGRAVECAGFFGPFAGRRPIFVGDDLPDVDGFRAATLAGGYGVSVGGALPWSRHRLAGPGETLDFLERAAGAR